MKTRLILLLTFIAFQGSFAKTISDYEIKKEVTVTDPVAPSLPNLSVCDDNNDGFSVFDLTVQTPIILAAQSSAASNYTVSYHENLTDASIGLNSLTSPYYNIGISTIYFRVKNNNTNEYAVGNFQLIVNPRPVATNPNDYELCDLNNNGVESFNLAILVPEILGAINPATVTVTFYTSLASADSGIGAIVPINAYTGTHGQTIWARVANNTTGCYDVVSFQLHVTPIPITIQPNYPQYSVCDYTGPMGSETFDLTTKIPSILMGQTDMNVIFYPSYGDAQSGLNPITNPSAYVNVPLYVQTLGIRVVNVATGCFSVSTMDIRVEPLPALIPPTNPYAICDSDQDGFGSFDLDAFIPNLLQGANYIVTFHETQTDAQIGAFAIASPYINIHPFSQTIYVRGEDTFTGCFSVIPIQLQVDPPFSLSTPTPLKVCDDYEVINDQYAKFNLTSKDNEILQGLTGYTVTYYPTFPVTSSSVAIANPTAYINVHPAVETLAVKVTSPGGCVSYTALDLRVYPIPMPNTNPNIIYACDFNNDGVETVDLTVNEAYVINGNPTLTLHYYLSFSDAIIKSNEILNPSAASVGNNVWIRVENTFTDFMENACYALVEQPVTINPAPDTDLISDNTLNAVFVDGSNNVVQPLTLDAQLYGNYSYQWEVDGVPIPDATFSTYLVNTASPNGESRVFSFTVEDLATGCVSGDSIVVEQSTGTPPPVGLLIQGFNEGDTLADLTAAGSNVLWYASATNKVTTAAPLPLNTLLVNETTYYASQTIGGIESIARLPVTALALLGVPTNEILPIQYAPNPVKNNLTLQSTKVLKSVLVYTILGQKVYEQSNDTSQVTIDLSSLASGNYIVKVQGETDQKVLRIIKE